MDIFGESSLELVKYGHGIESECTCYNDALKGKISAKFIFDAIKYYLLGGCKC